MTTELQTLRLPPNELNSQIHVKELLSNLISKPINSFELNKTLTPLLELERIKSIELNNELIESSKNLNNLLSTTRNQLATVLTRTKNLKNSHEVLEDGLIDHREALVSSLSQKELGGGEGTTLREKLQALSIRRKELQVAKDWFSILAKAEELGISALNTLETDLPSALQTYVSLVNYIKTVNETAASLALTSHLEAMAGSVWNGMVKVLSTRLVERLEGIAWPTPIKEPLDWEDSAAAQFKTSFVNLLTLEKTRLDNPLPQETYLGTKPLLALVPLIHPLLLRFRWHFEGDRGTNRIDKPEYPLSHVLNLLTTHERFINEDIQDLLDENGFEEVDAVIDFTSLLLPILSARLKHHIPQLLALPPILAHTIYQTLEFDTVLRSRNYRPKGLQGEWTGLSETILGKKEWYDQWLKGEREFFDSRYYAAISAPEAWQIISESDYDATDARSAIRPTNSALKVAELAERLSDRYRPLPTIYSFKFLLSLHLPLLSSYAQRITSSLDAFESLSFGLILPGALAEGRAATAGVGGIVRIARSVASARWMSEKCAEWGEDAFYLVLYHYLESNDVSKELEPLAKSVLNASSGTLFDGVRIEFEKQADRAEELVVRHVVREVLSELKSYLGRRWDSPPSELEEEEPTLTPDLIAPLSLFSALLASLVASFPSALSVTLYRKISSSLSQALYDRLLINRTWSETSAKQFEFDLENGFLQAAKGAGIKRGVGKGWELLSGAVKIMSLPSSSTNRNDNSGIGFSKVMQIAFDDGVGVGEGEGSEFALMMEELGVGERLRKKDVQNLMKRRPECWRT